MTQQDKRARRSEPRNPRKISPKYLENAALAYLQRYATSSENLRQVLLRRVKKSCDFHGTDIEEATRWTDALLERYKSSGILNDREYARARTQSLRRQGRSARMIQSMLNAKGLAQDEIENALSYVDKESGAENAEAKAAQAFARRRRLGPFRKEDKAGDAEYLRRKKQKELATMARAGFSLGVALKILEMDFSESFNGYD